MIKTKLVEIVQTQNCQTNFMCVQTQLNQLKYIVLGKLYQTSLLQQCNTVYYKLDIYLLTKLLKRISTSYKCSMHCAYPEF